MLRRYAATPLRRHQGIAIDMRNLFSARRAGVAALLVAYFILALGYGAVNPPFEGSEERNQFLYVRHLIEKRSLPVLQPGQPSENHQPPLYYTLAAGLTWWINAADFPEPVLQPNPFRGYRYWEVGVDNKNQYLHGPWDDPRYSPTALAVRLIRGLSALFGVGTVLLTWLLARQVCEDDAIALSAMALAAFNPMFLYISGSMGNDSAAAFSGAAILFAAARLMRQGFNSRNAVWLGLALGLGGLSKITAVFLLPAVELGLLWQAWRQRAWRDWLRVNAIALGLALALSGWVFARNIILYGEPTGVRQDFAVYGIRSFWDGVAVLPFELRFAWTTFWGRFGWGETPLPDMVYDALYGIVAAGWAGLMVYAARRLLKRDASKPEQPAILLVLLTAATTLLLALIWFTIHSATGNFGRYTFAAISATGVVLAWGLAALVPRRWRATLAGVCVAGMIALAVYALLGVMRPAYAPPPPLTAEQRQNIPNPLDITLGGRARLLGYAVDRTTAAPGERLYLTVYWEAAAPFDRNYAVFVHVLSEVGALVTQRDTHPGLGRYPTRAWSVGYAFADRIPIDLPETAYAPDQAEIVIGLYDVQTGERLLAPQAPDGIVRLTSLTIERPASGGYPLAINFNNEIALVAYELSERTVTAGQALTLTLHWQAIAPAAYDYNVFAHVLGQANHVWAANDGLPRTRPEHTSQWSSGQVYQDVRALRVAPETPPGIYPIELGWFGGPKVIRLPIIAADGHYLDDRLLLTYIKVTP